MAPLLLVFSHVALFLCAQDRAENGGVEYGVGRGLTVEALKQAIYRRGVPPPGSLMFHSDRGIQYVCDEFRAVLGEYHITQSMSRTGNCWDNAVAESFFSSLKKERIRKRIYKTRDLARADIFDYIEAFYNRTRRHSHLGGVSPEAFESAAA
jgi:putative transposase